MFNSTTLEVAIGMAFVYLLLSLFCTAVREGIAQIFNSRAKNLEAGIRSLFTEGLKNEEQTDGNVVTRQALSLADAIYRHGLVQSLYRSGKGTPDITPAKDIKNLPSYIPSRTFASALIDILLPDLHPPGATDAAGAALPPLSLQTAIDTLKQLPDNKARQALIAIVKQAGGDFAKTRQAFESWYDDAMDRVAGWYKRDTQTILFVIGLVIALALNVDSIAIAGTLWNNPALRSYAVAAAGQYAQQHPLKSTLAASPATNPPVRPTTAANTPTTAPTDQAVTSAGTDPQPGSTTSAATAAATDLAALQALNLPLGWTNNYASWSNAKPQDTTFALGSYHISLRGFIFALAGWLLTAIAMTYGAPFWFDLLNQFMVVRSTIKPREKSDVEPSKN